MGGATWYWIGVAAGFGVAWGVLIAALVPRMLIAGLGGAVLGAVDGYGVCGTWGAVAGLVGGAAGGIGTAPVISGALRRGGTRGGLIAFGVLGAIIVGGLALTAVLGYVAVVALPIFGLRMRSREPDRHAGLRTLAK